MPASARVRAADFTLALERTVMAGEEIRFPARESSNKVPQRHNADGPMVFVENRYRGNSKR